VVDGDTVIGVVSATDLLAFVASLPGVPAERADEAERGEWGELPGWEEGDVPPAAYFTDLWTDAEAGVDERFARVGGPEWDALAGRTVSEAMTRTVLSLPPDAEVSAAADFMRRAGIHRVLVMDGRRLAGIVSAMDIARAVADHQLTSRSYVFNRDRDFDERGWLSPAVPGDEGTPQVAQPTPEPEGDEVVDVQRAEEPAPKPSEV
jgi:CBS domain-containing protein